MKWFNHDVDTRNDDKIFELIEAHGMMGYGLWWLILEELYAAEKTGFQIEATETWFKRVSKQANLADWRSLCRVLDTMAEQKLIDLQLWAEHVIHCPGIMKRADTYVKKKALNAKRQATFRGKGKQKKEAESCVSNALLTHDIADVTPSKADSKADSNSKTDTKTDPEKFNTPLTPQGESVLNEADLEQKSVLESGAAEPPLAPAAPDPLSTSEAKRSERLSAAARRAKKAILGTQTKAKFEPDKFEAWWMIFRGHAQKNNHSPGDKAKSAIAWDVLHEINEVAPLAYATQSLAERIIDGTEAYWQRERLRGNTRVKNGENFLPKRDWEEALEWRDVYQHSSAIAIGKNFTPFLTCWNQDRPAAWPVVEEGDIDADTILQLERFISSCQNSLERFQKALLWVKRDEYWGLQRVLTFKEFLYSTKISEWSKKQFHHESLGIQNTVGGLAQAAKKHAQDIRFQKICEELDQDARQRQTASH